MANSYDKDLVKQAATGRWDDIISRLGGLAPEQMESRHQPCPRCDGTDRYRAFDDFRETGGVICNQCGKFSDGFATIEWLTGKKFGEVLQEVAELVGVEPSKRRRSSSRKCEKEKADPAKDLEFKSWNEGFAKFFCNAKGISEESLKASGAQRAIYKRTYTVFAFPILGESLDPENPVGWVLANYNGSELPKWDKSGNQVGSTKYKITYGSGSGIVGLHGVQRLQIAGLVELCWKVEGISDMLAMWDAIPEQLRDRVVVVTTANGTLETPRWQAGLIGTTNANVIHDADEDGQAGAIKWSQGIALQSLPGKKVRNVKLPYPVEKSKGKDIRDWFKEGHSYAELEALAEGVVEVALPRTESGEVDEDQLEYPVQERILKLLQLEVLYEEPNGTIRVFSTKLRKASSIRVISRMRKADLVQICGPITHGIVSSEPDNENTFAMTDIASAIAHYASLRRGKSDERGVGIWQGLDDYGHETDTVVLVNDGEAARWNGDSVLRKVLAPRADGLVLDFGAGSRDWFDFKLLERNIELAANPDWCNVAINETFDFLAQWTWRNQVNDPLLVTGLIMASWIETVWALRPMISVSGESNSGKSYLFEALGGSEHRLGIFGKLAYYQEKSSEAGIRQLGIGNYAKIVMCDEFEQSKDRQKIMETLRASSRGGLLTKGTADQKGMEFRVRHIVWTAAIESGLLKQPDLNRFIQLTLLKPPRKDHGKLRLPDGDYLYQLGQRLLAIAVRHAIAAKELAIELKNTIAEGADARVVEIYAVPTAMIAVASGYDGEQARNLLRSFLKNVEEENQGQSDQEELLEAILDSHVQCGPQDGSLTVAQIIQPPRMNSSVYHSNWQRLESCGIKMLPDDDPAYEGAMYMNWKQVRKDLLKGTDWERQNINEILLRIDGVVIGRRRIAGKNPRGLIIPSHLIFPNEREDGI